MSIPPIVQDVSNFIEGGLLAWLVVKHFAMARRIELLRERYISLSKLTTTLAAAVAHLCGLKRKEYEAKQ